MFRNVFCNDFPFFREICPIKPWQTSFLILAGKMVKSQQSWGLSIRLLQIEFETVLYKVFTRYLGRDPSGSTLCLTLVGYNFETRRLQGTSSPSAS